MLVHISHIHAYNHTLDIKGTHIYACMHHIYYTSIIYYMYMHIIINIYMVTYIYTYMGIIYMSGHIDNLHKYIVQCHAYTGMSHTLRHT